MRFLLLLVAILFVAAQSPAWAEEEQPQVMPTRDVDVSYLITRPNHPQTTERRRWMASEHLRRSDAPDHAYTIFDLDKSEFTIVNPANRTYRKFEGSPRMPQGPATGTRLKRGGEAVVAGCRCVDWSWNVDDETHTACLTPDGVLLRVTIDGKTILLARSVSYGRQSASVFQVPSNYEPALAPEGGPAD
jgi:hypothetical protein